MGKIQDLSALDKPREKAERFGIETLKDEELLALIINVGTVGHSSLDIARDLLHDVRSLSGLINKPYQFFVSFKGLKAAKALTLAAAIEIARRISERQRLVYEEEIEITSDSLYQRYAFSLSSLNQENLVIVILNKNKQIIYETTLYKGNDNTIALSSRDIIHLLIVHNGYYFYLIHNHPDGCLSPSGDDIVFTKKIEEKARQIDVKLLDHLIIGKTGYYSFLHENLLDECENN